MAGPISPPPPIVWSETLTGTILALILNFLTRLAISIWKESRLPDPTVISLISQLSHTLCCCSRCGNRIDSPPSSYTHHTSMLPLCLDTSLVRLLLISSHFLTRIMPWQKKRLSRSVLTYPCTSCLDLVIHCCHPIISTLGRMLATPASCRRLRTPCRMSVAMTSSVKLCLTGSKDRCSALRLLLAERIAWWARCKDGLRRSSTVSVRMMLP
mmetsp:Transcript_47286/g.93037  ORF Transcript_47286/g.93037 Transcript_47286/m.93037 type:complete len:212 (+) Transcript_47286:1155-1790(+)